MRLHRTQRGEEERGVGPGRRVQSGSAGTLCLGRARQEGRGETGVGGSRRGAPSLRGCLPECVGEEYGDYRIPHVSATKATGSACGGRRHSPEQNARWKVRATRNAEAGEDYDSQKSTRPRLPGARAAVPPESGLPSEELGLQLPASLAVTSRAPPRIPECSAPVRLLSLQSFRNAVLPCTKRNPGS